MIGSFSTALGTALTSFATSVASAIADNAAIVIPVAVGIVGIFLVWRVIKSFAGGR